MKGEGGGLGRNGPPASHSSHFRQMDGTDTRRSTERDVGDLLLRTRNVGGVPCRTVTIGGTQFGAGIAHSKKTLGTGLCGEGRVCGRRMQNGKSALPPPLKNAASRNAELFTVPSAGAQVPPVRRELWTVMGGLDP